MHTYMYIYRIYTYSLRYEVEERWVVTSMTSIDEHDEHDGDWLMV